MTSSEKAKDKRLAKIFKSSLEAFTAQMVKQDYRCAICRRPFIRGVTTEFEKEIYTAFQDHLHACCPARLKEYCGRCNRGLLCYICNKFVVGILEKMKIPADRLAAYMQEWEPILRQKGCYEAKEESPTVRKKKKSV
jgi:hypothetical protein